MVQYLLRGADRIEELEKQLDERTPVKVVACDRCHQFFEDPGKPVKQCPDIRHLVDAGASMRP